MDKLKFSDEHFQAHIFSSLQDAICAVDDNFHITYWNRMAEKMFGWTAPEAIGSASKDIFRMVLPSNREESIDNLLKNNGYIGEAVYRKKDGEVIFTSVVCSVIRSTLGEYMGNVSTYRDITDRKRAEEALRLSEDRFHLAVKAAREGVWDWNMETDEVWYSQRYKEMLGYSEHEIEHHLSAWQRLVHPHDKERALKHIEEVMRGEHHYEMEFRMQHKDGHYLTILSRGYPIRREPDNKIVRIVGTHFDLTDRKRAEEVLRGSEERQAYLLKLSDAIRPLSDAKSIQDAAVNLLVSHMKVSQASYTECYGEYTVIRSEYLYDSIPSMAGTYKSADYSAGTAILGSGRDMVIPDMSVFPEFSSEERARWLAINIHAVISIPLIKGGKLAATLTVRQSSPREWSDAEVELVRETAERTWAAVERSKIQKELRESEKKALALVKELEEADRNKDEFISALSHELRNPLAAISAALYLLEITQGDYHTSKAKETIKRQMKQLCKLVDDLLDVTRISKNKIKLKQEPITINSLVKNAIDDMKPDFEKKGISLGTRIQIRTISLYADPVRITQIIENILSNALIFTPQNGAVWVSLRQVKNQAVIKITDNGRGISPDILPHLFKPFFQVEQSLARQSGGLGLGLSIVKDIVELHGGSVSAFSAGLGRGSKFTICLPISVTEYRGE